MTRVSAERGVNRREQISAQRSELPKLVSTLTRATTGRTRTSESPNRIASVPAFQPHVILDGLIPIEAAQDRSPD